MPIYKNENGQLIEYTNGNSVSIDSALSTTSENAIMNKAVAMKIDEVDTALSSHAEAISSLNADLSNIRDAICNDEWNSLTVYSVGAYVIYNNALWKCLVQNSGQTPAEGTYWSKCSVADEINKLNSDKSGIIHKYIVPTESEYISGNDYNIGILDFTSYNKIISFQVLKGLGYVTCEDGTNLVFHCLKDCRVIRVFVTFSNDMTNI